MPPNNKKKKRSPKKKVATEPLNAGSQAAGTCGFCSKLIFSENEVKVECVCTRVVFCNDACRNKALSKGTHVCPGPPSDSVVDTNELLQELQRSGVTLQLQGGPMRAAFDEEVQRTLRTPNERIILMDACMSGRLRKSYTVRDFARLADRGQPTCAFEAGRRYKNRLLGETSLVGQGGGHVVSRSSNGEEQQSVLETNALAFKYMKQAAEAGIGIAMQSLGECYEKGIGVRESMLHCWNWLWHASLIRSVRALEMLDSKISVTKEHNAQVGLLEQGNQQLLPGQAMDTAEPNIGSLFQALARKLAVQEFSVPPFASAMPSATVGNAVRTETTPRLKIIGAEALGNLLSSVLSMEQNSKSVQIYYGRRRSDYAVSVQTHREEMRTLDSPVLVIPPECACDECVLPSEEKEWVQKVQRSDCGLNVACAHSKDEGLVCKSCLDDARARLAVVSSGTVALTEDDVLAGRGRWVIWRSSNGDLKQEAFEHYGRAEVECALACLVECHIALAHPLFIASDPNFFWPLIQSHGSVRAALEYCSPHIDWKSRLGPILDPPDRTPIVPGGLPGNYLRKCGNDLCLNLEPDLEHKRTHKECAKCERRSYCSPECLKLDWMMFHERECRAATSGSKPQATEAIPDLQEEESSMDNAFSLGETVVVNGLQNQPQFNGCVGTIGGEMTSQGRYPLKLFHQKKTLAIKPSNLCRLGVRYREATDKKFAQFKCLAHRLELCSDCSLDFGPANQISNVLFTFCATTVLRSEVDHILELHYSTVAEAQEDVKHGGQCSNDIPLECEGLIACSSSEERLFVLKSLLCLPKKDISIDIAATIAGLSSFGARKVHVCRTLIAKHLEVLMDKVYSNDHDRAS